MKTCEENSDEVHEIISDFKTYSLYSRGELLGRGGFAKCYLLTDIKTGRKVAGKIITGKKPNSNMYMMHEESDIHKKLKNPNILRMESCFSYSTYSCMILELCNDSLSGVLKKLKVLDETSCRYVVREVARGISYLHENQIIHRDIKPGNIFLTKDMDVKIGDFGLSIYHRDPTEKITEKCGTYAFYAPEVIDESGYSFGVDVWALGVTLYKMATGHYPFKFKTEQELYEKVKKCDYHFSSRIPARLGDMVRILLSHHADSRPGIDDVLKHDYLNFKNISRNHLRGCISEESLAKAINQKDPHECNTLPPSKKQNTPKEDCKVDENHGTGNIFQKGLRLGENHNENLGTREFFYDNTHGNENIPEKDLELDIERMSIFVLEEVQRVLCHFFKIVPQVFSPWDMDYIIEFFSFGRPKHFISRWITFDEECSLGYELTDSSVGVVYKDSTRLIVDCTMKNFQYIDQGNVREYFEYGNCPTKLNEKSNLLEYYKNYMETYLVAEQPSDERNKTKIIDNGIPIILKWKRNDKCICFLLLNGVLQVNFFEGDTKIIISAPTKSISIIGKGKILESYWYKGVRLFGWNDLKEKIPYIMEVVEEWISLEKKHEDDVTFEMESYQDFYGLFSKIIKDPTTGTKYSRGQLLGSGGFGTCYIFTDLRSKKRYAGKIVMKSTINWKRSMIFQETSIQMSIRHPNILRMYRFFHLPTYVFMTLELCKETLRDVLKRLEVLDEPSCRFILKEVACGISHLHGKQIIHRDIKPHNVFLTGDMDVKIGDFGVAVRHENSGKNIKKASGTTKFYAPESLDGSGYSFGVDVWALGVTLYKMAVGRYPFDGGCTHVLFDKIRRCEYSISSTVPSHTEEMIKILLTPDPNRRPGINDVLKHDYLSSENISKDHLREYVSKQLFVNDDNQRDYHESNGMLLNRVGNIPKGDCKLNANNGTQNIFQMELRLGLCNIGHRFMRKYCFDYISGNSNTPEKKLKIDIEEKSTFILGKVETIFDFLGSRERKRIPSSDMSSITPSPYGRSKHFVSRWSNFSNKNGLGYQLSDSSVGILFNDDCHMVADGTMKNFQYIDKNGIREYFEYDKCPSELSKKFKEFKYIKRNLESDSSAEAVIEKKEIKVVDGGIPIVLKWKRDDKCICFVIFNGVLQVNFFEDGTKFIVSLPTKSISIVDKDNKLKNYCCSMLFRDGWDEFLEEKMSYVMKVVKEWLSHKRKHEDDDSSVPRKRIYLLDDF
uniref:Serine/threonine-protein kinase PLK n=1 Tax=Strongyloides venezuelensis TaxID=75913 RepID=A0A0K0G289_STRVS